MSVDKLLRTWVVNRSGGARIVSLGLFLAASALLTRAADAHHSAAAYDAHRRVAVTGTVTRYEWANPHVYIYLEEQVGGQRVEWQVEGGSPSIFRRLGWSRTTLRPGDSITVIGEPAKDPAYKALLPVAITHGGTTLFDGRSAPTRLASSDTVASGGQAHGLEGVWLTLLDPKVIGRIDANALPLTPKGRAAHENFDEQKVHPAADCVPYPAPFFMVTPDLKRITKRAGVIVIDSEFFAAQRTIHVDRPTHEGAPTSTLGDSIGHWEGESLVIDTMRFVNNPVGNAYGVPSGSMRHLVERLTPSPDGKSLTYHFDLTDPEYIAGPVSGDVRWVFSPAAAYAPEKCNFENARRFIHADAAQP